MQKNNSKIFFTFTYGYLLTSFLFSVCSQNFVKLPCQPYSMLFVLVLYQWINYGNIITLFRFFIAYESHFYIHRLKQQFISKRCLGMIRSFVWFLFYSYLFLRKSCHIGVHSSWSQFGNAVASWYLSSLYNYILCITSWGFDPYSFVLYKFYLNTILQQLFNKNTSETYVLVSKCPTGPRSNY